MKLIDENAKLKIKSKAPIGISEDYALVLLFENHPS